MKNVYAIGANFLPENFISKISNKLKSEDEDIDKHAANHQTDFIEESTISVDEIEATIKKLMDKFGIDRPTLIQKIKEIKNDKQFMSSLNTADEAMATLLEIVESLDDKPIAEESINFAKDIDSLLSQVEVID